MGELPRVENGFFYFNSFKFNIFIITPSRTKFSGSSTIVENVSVVFVYLLTLGIIIISRKKKNIGYNNRVWVE